MFAEFPYKYIVFRQTTLNFMLLAGWAMQFQTVLERGLYQPTMYFKKTKPTEENDYQGDVVLFNTIHPLDSTPFFLIKVDLFDFELLLPSFEQLEDKEYLDPNQVVGQIDEEGNFTNYFLDNYYTSLRVGDDSENALMFYDYILNKNK